MSLVSVLVVSVIVIILTIYVSFYLLQDYLIFRVERLHADHSFSFHATFEELNFNIDSHITLNAVKFLSPESKGLIYYHHGNAGNIQLWGQRAHYFTNFGYDVLLYDYRGYGKSNGKIRHERTLYNDAEAVYNQIQEEYAGKRIIFYGISLGSGIAAYLAQKLNPDYLILETPYYSFLNVVKFHYPYLPARLISKYRFRTFRFLTHVTCDTLLIHGDLDNIIPVDSSEQLAQLHEHTTFCKIEGGAHNNLADFSEYEEILKKVLQ